MFETIAEIVAGGRDSSATEITREIMQALASPTKAMLDAGMKAADDALDSDWDSGPDGEGYNSYSTLRSDAPSSIWLAMLGAAEK